MIGSRWVDVETLDNIYEKIKLFKKSDRIKLYAQEFINENEEED